MFTENNKSYIKLNDVYDKYLLTETEDALETKDLMTIVDGYMLAFEESLKEEYFTKEEKTIKINNEDVKVNASTLKIDSTNISTLVTDIFTKLKSNNEFMTAYAKLQDITKEEAIKEMDDSISSLSDTSTWTEEMKKSLNYQITVYTKGLLNTPVGVGITSDKITYTMYFTEENIIVYQTMEGKETKVLDVSLNGNKYNVNMYVGEEVLSFIVGYSVEENPTFTKPDTSNSVKMEELTQEDTMNITMALMGSEGMQSLTSDFAAELQMLQMLLPSMGIGGDTPSTEMMEDTTSFQNMNSGITFESNATMSDDVTTGLNNFVFE
jgi:hypothetical protein